MGKDNIKHQDPVLQLSLAPAILLTEGLGMRKRSIPPTYCNTLGHVINCIAYKLDKHGSIHFEERKLGLDIFAEQFKVRCLPFDKTDS